MKLRATPLVAVGIAGLFLASAVGVVLVRQANDDDQVATDATTTTSFPPFEEDTTTTSLLADPNATVVTEVPAPPASVAPVPAPESASTTSSIAAAPTPVLASNPAPCPAPTSQPAAGAALGPSGVFTVAAADGAARIANPIGRVPAWRPKAGQVVSLSVADGKPAGLCLAAPDGGGAKPLTTPFGIGRPALSSDGARVAVRSSRPGMADIVAFSVEGADQKVLLQAPELGDPLWLGTGSVVACALLSGSRRIVAVPAGGGEARTLRDGCPPGQISASPDGSRIAYSQGNQVVVVNVTTRATSTLTIGTSVSTEGAPTWAPDSKRLAFAFTDASGPGLGMFDVIAGKGTANFRSAGLKMPSWAPAGDLISFVGVEGSGTALIVVKPDGTGRRVLAACQTRCSIGTQPWASDGSALAVELSGTAA